MRPLPGQNQVSAETRSKVVPRFEARVAAIVPNVERPLDEAVKVVPLERQARHDAVEPLRGVHAEAQLFKAKANGRFGRVLVCVGRGAERDGRRDR